MADQARVEIGQSRDFGRFAIIAAGVFVAYGVALATSADVSALTRILGAISATFFGLAGVAAWRTTTRKKVWWVFDATGIRSPNGRFPSIRWNELAVIRVKSIMGTRYLVIDVDDPHAYAARARGRAATTVRRNLNRGYGVTNIPMRWLNHSAGDVVRLANWKRALVLPGAEDLSPPDVTNRPTRDRTMVLVVVGASTQILQVITAFGRAPAGWRVALSVIAVAGAVAIVTAALGHRLAALRLIVAGEAALIVTIAVFAHGSLNRRVVMVTLPALVVLMVLMGIAEIRQQAQVSDVQ